MATMNNSIWKNTYTSSERDRVGDGQTYGRKERKREYRGTGREIERKKNCQRKSRRYFASEMERQQHTINSCKFFFSPKTFSTCNTFSCAQRLPSFHPHSKFNFYCCCCYGNCLTHELLSTFCFCLPRTTFDVICCYKMCSRKKNSLHQF